ncbi:unnamed protein product [Danaus chrysippus]|uniref:(African queen) hypothetical protein n=1 Tax=Danaus chrysippus TaxID=151541 RepID=A0A8J2R3J4_9NEOP|nr:unnamed protein product [Danaus chrysippus]
MSGPRRNTSAVYLIAAEARTNTISGAHLTQVTHTHLLQDQRHMDRSRHFSFARDISLSGVCLCIVLRSVRRNPCPQTKAGLCWVLVV